MSTPKTATAKKIFAFILGVLFFVVSPLAGLTQGTDSVTSTCNKNPQACIDLGLLKAANQVQPFGRNIIRQNGANRLVAGTTNGVGTADLTFIERVGTGLAAIFMGAAVYDALRNKGIDKLGLDQRQLFCNGYPSQFYFPPGSYLAPGRWPGANVFTPDGVNTSYSCPYPDAALLKVPTTWQELSQAQRDAAIDALSPQDFYEIAKPTEIDLNPQPGDEFYFEDAPDRRIAWDSDPYPYHSPTPNPTPTFSPVPSPTPTNSPLLPPPEPDPTPTPQPSPNPTPTTQPSPSPSPSPEPSPSPSPCNSPPPSIAPTPTATGTPKVVDPEEILNKSCDGDENVFSYGICKLKDRFPLDILSGPSPGSNPECPQLEFFGQELPEFCEIINGHLSGVKWLIWFLFSLRAITYL